MTAPRLGRYELVRKIAAGGMAEIFLARQWGAANFFRDVVVKRLFRHLAENERQLRMFEDEGRLLAALSHPNIPQAYDLGQADGYWYVAMEYVDGWNVADVWRQGAKQGQPMPLHVAIGIVMQACEALHHAHERTDRAKRPLHIVHRDVTPQNLMLTRDGVVKLMDFGVALSRARKDTEAGAVRGTFSYMAPEQVRAKPLDKRADIFAIGVILYELTTGSRLFRGSEVQVMTEVVEKDVPRPSERVPGYPQDLEKIVLGALERDRARRTPSAAHLATKLEEFAQRHGLPVGPRAVARYLASIVPAEPVREEELAMVAGDEGEDAEGADADTGHHVAPPDFDDHEGLLEDLDLLSLPPSAPAQNEGYQEVASGEASLDLLVEDPMSEFADASAVQPASQPPEPASRPPGPRLPRGVVPLDRDALSLEGTEEERPRPVVLLGAPKRKPAGADYVRELEKRLATEDDES